MDALVNTRMSMLPSLGQLPVGAAGPLGMEADFERPFSPPAAKPWSGVKANDAANGRVVDAHGNGQSREDAADLWRRENLARMEARHAAGTYQLPLHRTSPIPPVPWEGGVEVLADGTLKNVFASTPAAPEVPVPVPHGRVVGGRGKPPRLVDAPGTCQPPMHRKSPIPPVPWEGGVAVARALDTISSTDGGKTLNWLDFYSKLWKAAPALTVGGASGIAFALYRLYTLQKEAARHGGDGERWPGWDACAAPLWACGASAALDDRATLSKSLIY